jgi:uncharacterized membrane protein YraQ (UPF0718 family)
MKAYIKKFKIDFIIIFFFLVFAVLSHIMKFSDGKIVTGNFTGFSIEMLSFIPLMFILIGLFDVWFPREKVEKHIGKESGLRGIVWVILLAMLQAGPLYGAFPVAYILWKKGASIRNIFIYLGAFSTLKIPMLAFEIGFLGVKFSLMRALITLPVFILIGVIMERLYNKGNFSVSSPE